MNLNTLKGKWTISTSTIKPLIRPGDKVIIHVVNRNEAAVRIRRDNVTVLLTLGFADNGYLACHLPFCWIGFYREGDVLHFEVETFEGGSTPEGGGTSVGPPAKA